MTVYDASCHKQVSDCLKPNPDEKCIQQDTYKSMCMQAKNINNKASFDASLSLGVNQSECVS